MPHPMIVKTLELESGWYKFVATKVASADVADPREWEVIARDQHSFGGDTTEQIGSSLNCHWLIGVKSKVRTWVIQAE